ncbi:MAG: hypothetical protein WDN31_05315 [Hyphomicrobium sp.]
MRRPDRQEIEKLFSQRFPPREIGMVVPPSLSIWPRENRPNDLVGKTKPWIEAGETIEDYCRLLIWANAIAKNLKERLINIGPSGDALADHDVKVVRSRLDRLTPWPACSVARRHM